MNTPTRLALFGLTLVAVFAAAAGLGNATGPIGPRGPSAGAAMSGMQHAEPAEAGHSPAAPDVTGLAVSQNGYTLDLSTTALPVGRAMPFTFRIRTAAGTALQAYTRTHDKELHLIVIRRDTQHFQHVHPVRDAGGTWSVPLTLPAAGDYKVFADFSPAGANRSLALVGDISAAGDYRPEPLPPVAGVTEGGGYSVALTGDLVAGRASTITLTLSRAGRPVTDLQPYLAAYGHVVVLRQGDLAYLHVHPEDDAADPATRPGPSLRFAIDVPTSGTYRLFLDFQHNGRVRTAPFTVQAKEAAA